MYQGTVNEEMAIAAYKSINQAANDYLSEIPLPLLIQVENDPSVPLAQLIVIFNYDGRLEVTRSF